MLGFYNQPLCGLGPRIVFLPEAANDDVERLDNRDVDECSDRTSYANHSTKLTPSGLYASPAGDRAMDMSPRNSVLYLNDYIFGGAPSFIRTDSSSLLSERSDANRRVLRRRMRKKERVKASCHLAEEYPEYKGHMTLEELLDYINKGQQKKSGEQKQQHDAMQQSGDCCSGVKSQQKKKSKLPELAESCDESSTITVDSGPNVKSVVESGVWERELNIDEEIAKRKFARCDSVETGSKHDSEGNIMKSVSPLGKDIDRNCNRDCQMLAMSTMLTSSKNDSNETNSDETDSIVSSLQEYCLSDGGLDLVSSSVGDKEFITVHKKKKTKGQQKLFPVSCDTSIRNEFGLVPSNTYIARKPRFTSETVGGKLKAYDLTAVRSLADDESSPHLDSNGNRPVVSEKQLCTKPETSPLSAVEKPTSVIAPNRALYSRAVGESRQHGDVEEALLCPSGFPDLRRNCAENLRAGLTGNKASLVTAVLTSEAAAVVQSAKEFTISYASIAAASVKSPSSNSDKSGANRRAVGATRNERERRHSFDSGAETLQYSAGNNLFEKGSSDDTAVGSSRHAALSPTRQLSSSTQAISAAEAQAVMPNSCSKNCDNNSNCCCNSSKCRLSDGVEIEIDKSHDPGKDRSLSLDNNRQFSVADVQQTNVSGSPSRFSLDLIARSSDASQAHVSSGVKPVISSVVSSSKSDSTPVLSSSSFHTSSSATATRASEGQRGKRVSCEPVVFLDAGKEKLENVSRSMEISFGFDVDNNDGITFGESITEVSNTGGNSRSMDCVSIATSGVTVSPCAPAHSHINAVVGQLQSKVETQGEKSQEIESLPSAGKCTRCQQDESSEAHPSTDSATSPINCFLSFTDESNLDASTSNDASVRPQSNSRVSTPSRGISSPSFAVSQGSSHSRPIALMTGPSSSQTVRTPVGVVPPLHFDRTKPSSRPMQSSLLNQYRTLYPAVMIKD